jgi:hypothetical protein
MTLRRMVAVASIALASAASAFADPPATIYVTSGPGRQILAIPINTTTGLQAGPASTLETAGAAVTDLTQRSDGALFYATSDRVRRVGQDSAVASVAGAQELRFTAFNCLFYNRAGGVNSVGCGNSSAPTGLGGRGLALNPFGHLLAISGNAVVRIPLDAMGNKGTPVTIVSSGLTAPTGIAVAAGKGSNGLERGDFVVVDRRYVRLYDGKTGALKNAAYASLPQGQTINFADFDADDRLWLAAMTSNSASELPNGRVYRVDAADAVCGIEPTHCALIAVLPQSQERYWPAVGLALGPSSRVLTQSLAPTVPNVEQTFRFDFGGSIVEINAVVLDACELRVSGGTRLAPAVTTLISNQLYSLNPYLGDEGFPTVYHIASFKNGTEVDANACVEVSSATRPSLLFAALTSSEMNPRILRCESGCSESELFGWWHTGPIDGDGEGGTRGNDWSEWLIVQKAVAPAASQVQFCGVAPPLRTNRIATFNAGSNLTIKAQFSAPGQPCDSGALTDPNARFLISLARVLPGHERKRLIGASGSSGAPPVMGLAGKSYDFELSLNEPNGDDYAEGTYEITLTDVTPGAARLATPVTIYFAIGRKE